MQTIPEHTTCSWCKTQPATLAYSTFDFFSCQECYWDHHFKNDRRDLLCGMCFQKPFQYVGNPPTCDTCYMGHPPEGIPCVVCGAHKATMSWDNHVYDHCADCYWDQHTHEKRLRIERREIKEIIQTQMKEGKTKEEITKMIQDSYVYFDPKDFPELV